MSDIETNRDFNGNIFSQSIEDDSRNVTAFGGGETAKISFTRIVEEIQ